MDEFAMTELGRLRIERRQDVTIVAAEGEIDLSNADVFSRRLRRAVDPAARGLVVDLDLVTYIDSVGIRQLFTIAAHLSQRRQEMRLVLPDGSRLQPVMRAAGIENAIEIHGSVDAALSSLGVA